MGMMREWPPAASASPGEHRDWRKIAAPDQRRISVTSTNRITFDPAVMGGKACIRGLRVTVGAVLELFAAGHSEAVDVAPGFSGIRRY